MKERVTAFLLAGVIGIVLTACGGTADDPGRTADDPGVTADDHTKGSDPAPADNWETDSALDGRREPNDTEATYTYRTAVSEFPTNWSPALAATDADADLIRYLTVPLFAFDYNENRDRCVIKICAAAGEPADVTADYVGRWGIRAGDTCRVWRIPLREDVTWEDGTPITSHDYISSARLLLDPAAKNTRAGLFFASSFKIVNAKKYYDSDGTDRRTEFSEVGFAAPSDYELVIALEKPLDGAALRYALTESWLLKEDLYVSCESVIDGIYTNTYGTSVETTASCGPYKLVSFQKDQEYVLERNEYYFNLYGKYQTTTCRVQCVKDAGKRLTMFLRGQLDACILTAGDAQAYADKDYAYEMTGAANYFVAMNPDPDALAEKQAALGEDYNKSILTVREFRQALSRSIDREAFVRVAAPSHHAAFGLLSDQMICSPDNGQSYRSTEEAKRLLADFWELSGDVGEEKTYADLDDALGSMTGCDLAKARQKFTEAYLIAFRKGLIDRNDVVQITIGIPNRTSAFYARGSEFLINCWTEAVIGTPLEGRLTFVVKTVSGNDLAAALQNNEVDMLFGVGFEGSVLDPYRLMQCYTTNDAVRCNVYRDTENEPLTIQLDGVDYTASVADWTRAVTGDSIVMTDAAGNEKVFSAGEADGNPDERLKILTSLEGAVLETYELLPLMDDTVVQLKGGKVRYATETYVPGMEFGGLEYLTYRYSDAEWDARIAQ